MIDFSRLVLVAALVVGATTIAGALFEIVAALLTTVRRRAIVQRTLGENVLHFWLSEDELRAREKKREKLTVK